MTAWTQKAQLARWRAIPLETVLQQWGAQPDRYDAHKWHTPQGTLSVTGAKFMNWTRGQGGGGAIDLVIHLTQRGFAQAVQWLALHFPEPTLPLTSPPQGTPASLHLPTPVPNQLDRVRHYLVQERCLPPGLLEPLIQAGSLYADAQANAVFLLRDPHGGRPVGAELRGTTLRPWRGMAPGSHKDHGYFVLPYPPQEAAILCESAIDAISCLALHPQHRCLSTAGARPHPRWLPALLAQEATVYCGYDADPVGDAMAQAMLARYPTVQRLRPTRKDWNDVLRSLA